LALAANRTVLIGPGFWNVRASFKIDGFEIGTQMSLIKLNSGKFLLLDTVELDWALKQEINDLTNNGDLIEAVIATHPFHTVYFPDFYKAYPKSMYIGTPRHLRNQKMIPWNGSIWDCNWRQRWNPEVRMRIPRGSEFETPPNENIHFTGVHVFHEKSKTFHIDDTVTINEPFHGNMLFHPTLLTGGLYHIPESPPAFSNFVQKMIDNWDFDNIVAAHNGVKKGGAKTQLQHLLDLSQVVLNALVVEYRHRPSERDAQLFKSMEAHESSCKE